MMDTIAIPPALISKYNQPVPRYTSYPTVPFWEQAINVQQWRQRFAERFTTANAARGISLYIHLPFCESLCTYCGCNKKITANHAVEEEYIEALLKEWELYRRLMGAWPLVKEIHLGGGTPTFFSPENLYRLLSTIISQSIIPVDSQFSIEGHPNNTTREHLDTLYQLGFRRISYGVQDLDPRVQQVINRVQPFGAVQEATLAARAAGFTSVNFDLIYGLPLQTLDSITRTIQQVSTLQPDRIAFYSYAHVPWTSRGQRLFNEADLPDAATKLQLYLKGKALLLENGYIDIGMDHFALPNDELCRAKHEGRLHRNFMGYTTQNSGLLLGLGVSAISDVSNGFAQNTKSLHTYYETIRAGRLPVEKGFFLSAEDVAFRRYIQEVACRGATRFARADLRLLERYSFPVLLELEADGLLTVDQYGLQLTPTGHYFIRNVCSAFDLYLQRNRSVNTRSAFSKAI